MSRPFHSGPVLLVVVSVMAGCSSGHEPTSVSQTPSVAPSEWTTLAPMPTPRFIAGAAVAGGRLYVVGGRNNVNEANHSVADTTLEAYDPASDRWSRLAPMPTRRYEVAAGAVNGIVYAIGGWAWVPSENYVGVSDIVEAYDPATDSWTTKAPMPLARTDPAVAVASGVLYAVGGLDATRISGEVDAYDAVRNAWKTKAPLPQPLNGIGIAAVNDRLYVVGGLADSGIVSSVYEYDPQRNCWTAKAPMPTARYGLSVGVVNGLLYAVGGHGGPMWDYLATVEVYDPATDRWSASPPMRAPLYFLNVVGIGDRLYAVGGGTTDSSNGWDTVTGLLESYTPH